MKKITMRTYVKNADGYVDYSKFTKDLVNIDEPFPLGTFLISHDYAIEDSNGELRWLNAARVYNGNEYCEFSGQKNYEKRGTVIWRR